MNTLDLRHITSKMLFPTVSFELQSFLLKFTFLVSSSIYEENYFNTNLDIKRSAE